MQKVLRSALAGSIVVLALALSTAPGWAGPSRVGQYKPDPIPTTSAVVAPAQVGRGATEGSGGGALPTTGAESRDLAAKGAALVLVGIGLVVVRRRSQART